MKKRALITGITGQDGSYLADLLLGEGMEVHGILRPVAPEEAGYQQRNIRHLQGKIHLHVMDLEEKPAVTRKVEALKPDELYHLAAATFVSYSFENGASVVNQSFSATHNLLSAVKQWVPACHVVFAGSSEMFGAVAKSPQNEDTPLNPRSMYGISRVSGHFLVTNFRAGGLFACTAFLYNHESPRRNLQFVTRKISHACARIKLGLQDSIVLGNLEAVRDWGYAPDYVRALTLMARNSEPVDYVVATGTLHTVRQFAETAFAHVGLRLADYLKVDNSFFRPSEKVPLCGDSRKVAGELGWRHSKSFEEIVAEMVDADLAELSGRAR